jgi:hypothetical protein
VDFTCIAIDTLQEPLDYPGAGGTHLRLAGPEVIVGTGDMAFTVPSSRIRAARFRVLHTA